MSDSTSRLVRSIAGNDTCSRLPRFSGGATDSIGARRSNQSVQSPNPNFEQFGLEDGDPVRFIVEFDPASPTETVDRLLIQLDGTTFTNSTNYEHGTFFSFGSSSDTGFGFSVVSLDIFHGVLNGLDFTLDVATAVRTVFELQADEVSTAARFPVDLTFEDLTDAQSGFFSLGTVPPSGDSSDLFSIDFSDLNIHVIPEPTAAALILSALATVLWLRAPKREIPGSVENLHSHKNHDVVCEDEQA